MFYKHILADNNDKGLILM